MIGLIFNSFSNRNYLEEKIELFLKAKESNYADSSAVVKQIASQIHPQNLELPVAAKDDIFRGFDKTQSEVMRDKIATMTKTINRQYPMTKDESIVSDFFTFLVKDYGKYKKGTPLLIRKTNKATMIRILDHLEYKSGDIIFKDLDDEKRKEIFLPKYEVGGADDLISSLFSGMAKALAGKIGATIFDTLFPDTSTGMEEMFQLLETDIRNIFREELDEKTIDDLNYQINGVVSYMQQTYIPTKDSGRDKRFLEGELSDMNQIMYTNVMALLTGPRYRADGIAYLVLGANTHLSIVQEMANIDPTCTDPDKSSYMQTYYMLLNSYIESLQGAINDINTQRQTYLGPLQESSLKGAANDHWWFIDNWAGFHSDNYYNTPDGCCDYKFDAKSKAKKARDDYNKDTFQPTIKNDLQPYNDTLKEWNQIAKSDVNQEK